MPGATRQIAISFPGHWQAPAPARRVQKLQAAAI
jgi:hypothetical protein